MTETYERRKKGVIRRVYVGNFGSNCHRRTHLRETGEEGRLPCEKGDTRDRGTCEGMSGRRYDSNKNKGRGVEYTRMQTEQNRLGRFV